MSSVSLAFQAYLQQVESDKLKALQEKAGIKPIPDELAETYNYGTSSSIGPIPGPLGLAPPTQQFQNQKYYPHDQLTEDDIMKAASGINQYRIHRGYHYPRSFETINRLSP